MHFSGLLEKVFGSPEKIRVLEVLLRYPTKRFSGREVARLARVSAPGTWRILKLLESHGLLSRIRVGRTDVWQVREEHFLVKKLSKTKSLDKDALSLLKEIVLKHLQGLSVKKLWLFGSVARGTARPNSDLDLLVIVENGKDKRSAYKNLLNASMDCLSVFGNPLSPIVYSQKEFNKKKGLPLVVNIKKEGRILWQEGDLIE